MVFNLETCARPNILALKPYRCARDDYKDDGTNILLDANENAYGPSLPLDENGRINSSDDVASNGNLKLKGLNRYPDPHQNELKALLCKLRQPSSPHPSVDGERITPLTPENLFVGVGSDEAIDALLRCFCVPGRDKILTCPPTYGMYSVSAQINDIAVVPVPLDVSTPNAFDVDVPAVLATLERDQAIKIVYLCSPGNPTGKLILESTVKSILEYQSWNGIVVLDEAYIDFAGEGRSLAYMVNAYPNLVVMQTLSKAFGMAGIRLGAAFCSPPVARLLNNLKAPYNISSVTSQLACAALSPSGLTIQRSNVNSILSQRKRMLEELIKIPGIGGFLGGFDANFLLVTLLDAPSSEEKSGGGKPDNTVAKICYERLAEVKGVVVRFRGNEWGCTGGLRITVGTEEENTRLLAEMTNVLAEIYSKGK